MASGVSSGDTVKGSHGTNISQDECDQVKNKLNGWREVLVPLNSIVHWEQPHYPVLLSLAISVIFVLVWEMEPSVLTAFSVLGLVLCILDYVVPTIAASSRVRQQWTEEQEAKYDAICRRIVELKRSFRKISDAIVALKRDKPVMHSVLLMATFFVLAVIGTMFDNLLLTYLLVLGIVLSPGAKKHDVVKRFISSATIVFKRLVLGVKEDPAKKQR